jgi:hypothetical protein
MIVSTIQAFIPGDYFGITIYIILADCEKSGISFDKLRDKRSGIWRTDRSVVSLCGNIG